MARKDCQVGDLAVHTDRFRDVRHPSAFTASDSNVKMEATRGEINESYQAYETGQAFKMTSGVFANCIPLFSFGKAP